MSDKGLFAQSAQDYRGIETEELILEEGNAGSGLSPKDVTGVKIQADNQPDDDYLEAFSVNLRNGESTSGSEDGPRVPKLKKFSPIKYSVSLVIWYIASTSITLYLKWLYDPKKYGFEFPLFSASLSLMTQMLMSLAILTIRRGSVRFSSNKIFDTKILTICGSLAGLDIGLANSGLKVSSISLYTVVRSTSPIFTLIVAHIRRIEKITPTLSLLILVITSSVALTAVEDLSFDTVGYIYAQSSTIISSLRWVFVQDLLLKSCFPKSYGSIDTSLLTMIWTLPTASLVSLIASLILDGPRSILSSSKLSSWSLALKTFLLFNVESVLGIIILLTELFSLSMISALAFILVGITKEIIVIIAAHFFLNEPLTVIQILGVVISIIGLFTFQYIRTVKKNVDDSG